MKCKNCKRALSTTVGSRPVLMCRHLLCETCAADLECPICGVTADEQQEQQSDLNVDDLIDQELLQNLLEVEGSRAASASASADVYYKCSSHANVDIAFYCSQHDILMCVECAWPHISEHRDQVIPYSKLDLDNDFAKIRDAIQNIENDCTVLKKSIDNVNNLKPKEGEVLQLLHHALQFAQKSNQDAIACKINSRRRPVIEPFLLNSTPQFDESCEKVKKSEHKEHKHEHKEKRSKKSNRSADDDLRQEVIAKYHAGRKSEIKKSVRSEEDD